MSRCGTQQGSLKKSSPVIPSPCDSRLMRGEMLGRKERSQLELFISGSLRQLIPDDHVLVRVDRVLDLSWLRDEVADCYCLDDGRPGIDPPGAPVGNLSLEFDKEGKLWFDTMHQGAIGTIDPNNGEIIYYPLPPEWNDNRVQLNFVRLRHDVDGKVWTKSVGTVDVFRLDLVSGKWERFHPTDFLPPGHRYSIYQLTSNSETTCGWLNLRRATSARSMRRR